MYEDVLRFKNLYAGLKKSCRNVRWKASVVGYESNALVNTLRLQEDLMNGKYKIGAYQIFKIHEPKERTIVATKIRDRQFQRSLCDNSFYSEITKSFIYDNGACLKGRGTDFTLKRMKKHLCQYYRQFGTEGWVLKCDIRKFFDSTPHEVAKEAVIKRVSDKRVSDAVCNIVDSFEGEKGIGLGSQVSQLIQLAVLDDLDHYIKEHLHIKHYVRYMDDFVLVHQDKEHLKYCRKEIERILAEKGLVLNEKTKLHPLKQGIKLMKWRFLIKPTGKIIMTPQHKKKAIIKRKIRKLWNRELLGLVDAGTTAECMQSMLANLYKGNTYNLIQKLKKFYKELTTWN